MEGPSREHVRGAKSFGPVSSVPVHGGQDVTDAVSYLGADPFFLDRKGKGSRKVFLVYLRKGVQCQILYHTI